MPADSIHNKLVHKNIPPDFGGLGLVFVVKAQEDCSQLGILRRFGFDGEILNDLPQGAKHLEAVDRMDVHGDVAVVIRDPVPARERNPEVECPGAISCDAQAEPRRFNRPATARFSDRPAQGGVQPVTHVIPGHCRMNPSISAWVSNT